MITETIVFLDSMIKAGYLGKDVDKRSTCIYLASLIKDQDKRRAVYRELFGMEDFEFRAGAERHVAQLSDVLKKVGIDHELVLDGGNIEKSGAWAEADAHYQEYDCAILTHKMCFYFREGVLVHTR